MKVLKNFFHNNGLLIFLVVIIGIFFIPFIRTGKIPIPADSLLGMYHPWRDVTWDSYTAGVPFKNYLITDPIRQQYVWRKLSIDAIKKGTLPIWNPYQLAGSPLAANVQSAPYYPLNILFFILPFPLAWGMLVLLQPLLSGIFLYFYLQNRRLSKMGSFIASVSFAFSGFAVSWME
jgi:hypothetical protein